MQETDKIQTKRHISGGIVRLSWEDKIKLCEEWKRSGLKREFFCKEKEIARSTFAGWWSKIWPVERKEGLKKLCPVDVSERSSPAASCEPIVLEVSFPNAVVARVKATEMQFSLLFRELLNATAIVR